MISEEELNQIINLSESVPPEYRVKCFEILLSHWLENHPVQIPPNQVGGTSPIDSAIFPVEVNAFLSQFHLDKSEIGRLFHFQEGRIVPLYKLESKTKSKAEIEHALLMAFESALSTGSFQVDVDLLRRRCQEDRCYDIANFMRHLRKNAALFRTVSPGGALVLSSEGKAALAELIHELTG